MTSTPDETTPGERVDAAMKLPEAAPPVRTHSPAYPLLPLGLGLVFAAQILTALGISRTLAELGSLYFEPQPGWFILGGVCTLVGGIMVIVGAGRLTSHIDDLHLTLLRPDPAGRH